MTHRPFTVQEFLDLPPHAWCRDKEHQDGVFRATGCFKYGETPSSASITFGSLDWGLNTLCERWQLSLDGGRTWQPFGVKVEEA